MNACMNKTESSLVMAADKACAERIKQSILQNFTYDDIENETGISVSTLKRLALMNPLMIFIKIIKLR